MRPRNPPSFELQRLVEQELGRDERVAWTGQPDGTRMALASIPIVLFAIPWTAFACFWIVAASGFKVPTFEGPEGWFPLFGVPFVLVGLGMLSSPYWVIRQARKTIYAVTTKRILTLSPGALFGGVSVESYFPDAETRLKRIQRADGSGDLIIGQYGEEEPSAFSAEGRRRARLAGLEGFRGRVSHAVRLVGIPEVREVENLVQALAATPHL